LIFFCVGLFDTVFNQPPLFNPLHPLIALIVYLNYFSQALIFVLALVFRGCSLDVLKREDALLDWQAIQKSFRNGVYYLCPLLDCLEAVLFLLASEQLLLEV